MNSVTCDSVRIAVTAHATAAAGQHIRKLARIGLEMMPIEHCSTSASRLWNNN